MLVAVSVRGANCAAQEPGANPSAASEKQGDSGDEKILKMRAKAIAYLKASQADNGSFSEPLGPGVTALVTYALLRNDLPLNDPAVVAALKYLEKQVQPDGGVYRGDTVQNYETSLALMCFLEANRDGRYDTLIANATRFVKKIQWDEGEGIDPTDARYGGQGYGSHQRPDLSNTSMFIDALEALGTDDNDPAIQAALKFVSNTQNLDSPYNTTKFGKLINDGGFYYTPAGEGESKALTTENGGLRSYASMTYAGFKSLLYAGVDRDDPRVRAAHEWIADHYTMDENPGIGQQGLYYYYHVVAKALAAWGEPTITDNAGKSHDWRTDLVDALAKRQREDGSWVNETDRWYEGDGGLVTGYCLLALSYCDKP
jgi:squalene-hopene/tetraprenyl-beta-curcumene cyclase